jgi:inosose dehydratase
VVRTKEDYNVVLNSLDPRYTGWTPDVGHIIRGGMNVIDTMNEWAHLINHVHYKDFSGNGEEPWAQMGTGKLDFHAITEWLVRRNYEGYIVCEDECHQAVDDPDGVTLQNGQWCRDNLQPLLD